LYNPVSKKYLIEENDIRLVTSARDLFKKKSKGQSKNYAILLGDPKFDEHKAFFKEKNNEVQIARLRSAGDPSQLSFEQLPGAKKEVEKINSILQKRKWKTDLLVGDAATEEKIKTANNPKVLHIATHGCFLDLDDHHSFDTRESHKFFESPMLGSFLVLSGSKAKGRPNPMADEENVDILDDGFLTAYEAMNLDLENTDLVVLSACETALGEVRNGEGVYGLQRAFLAAGVSTIIMSLWPVDDESTRDLMVKFYENWASGTNVRTAFRKAQLELKQKKPEFYYWGGFVIAGE
jgi:CHAT domain-containing protein